MSDFPYSFLLPTSPSCLLSLLGGDKAEVTRTTRVNLWSIAWCAFIAWLLHWVWWFPQPIGLLLAAVIAFTVQLSSTWMPPSRRQSLVEQEV